MLSNYKSIKSCISTRNYFKNMSGILSPACFTPLKTELRSVRESKTHVDSTNTTVLQLTCGEHQIIHQSVFISCSGLCIKEYKFY